MIEAAFVSVLLILITASYALYFVDGILIAYAAASALWGVGMALYFCHRVSVMLDNSAEEAEASFDCGRLSVNAEDLKRRSGETQRAHIFLASALFALSSLCPPIDQKNGMIFAVSIGGFFLLLCVLQFIRNVRMTNSICAGMYCNIPNKAEAARTMQLARYYQFRPDRAMGIAIAYSVFSEVISIAVLLLAF